MSGTLENILRSGASLESLIGGPQGAVLQGGGVTRPRHAVESYRRIRQRVPGKLPSKPPLHISNTRISFMPEMFFKTHDLDKNQETLLKLIHARVARSSPSPRLPGVLCYRGWPQGSLGHGILGVPQGVPPGGPATPPLEDAFSNNLIHVLPEVF